MDFQVSDDQRALAEGVRAFCAGRLPGETIAQLANEGGSDPDLWKDLAELGVFALRTAESDGGLGLGFCEAVLVFEELGRRVAPGPLAWSHLATRYVEGAADGTTRVGGIDRRGAHADDPILVEHLDFIDCLLVLDESGIHRVDPKQVKGEKIEIPLDALTPLHRVGELPAGERLGDSEEAERLRREGAALVAAQQLGIAEATLDMAVAYAKTREQFGRPIGSFQALKHMMADMFVRQEIARAAVYAAGATLDDPAVGSIPRAVSSAKIMASEAALQNAGTCIQIHGGMGYTWEVPAHYFLKRARVFECLFGTVAEHNERSAEYLSERAEALCETRRQDRLGIY